MKKNERFFLLIFLIFIIGSSIVFSATLSGSIYDFDLNPAFDVRLTINSSPEQFFVSKNGSYSFSLLQGSYSLTAEQISFGSLIASAKEDIIISDDGMFILDILLFPFFEDEIGDDIELLDIESEGLIEEKNYAPLIIFFSFFIFVLLLVSFYFDFFNMDKFI
jgi:uncharacterized membrane protein